MKANRANEPVILYFGNDWQAENRTSSHHIACNLAERYRVYYLECPGLRAPKSSGRDLRKIVSKVGRFFQGLKTVHPRLKVGTLLQVPLHRFAFVRWLNSILILLTLRFLMWREGVRRPLIWFMVPHLGQVVGKLGERLSVYYCIDDYAALPDVNARVVGAMDEQLTRKADVVFVAARPLHAKKQAVNPHSYLSPHGVDFTHFARAQNQTLAIPEDIKALPGPVIGFVGLIEAWIDIDLIAFLARQRPEWSFALIGRLAVPAKELENRPNVHLLGKRPYQELPAYGRAFDAAIIPYRLNQQVLHANPIKLREYLAMGKPVVTVRTPEIEKYADVVRIADSYAEFLDHLDDILAERDPAREVWKRMKRVAQETWDKRLDQVIQTIRSHSSAIF